MCWNQKLEVAFAFQKYQSIGHQKVAEEDSSQDKLWLMPSLFSSQNVIFYENLVFKQEIHVHMDADPAPYWANLFLYFFGSK